jgi:cystathionine gamma-synthase
MTREALHSPPFGESIPLHNPHAVSVSLPTLGDVKRLFTENDPAAWAELKAIYPRFGNQPYVQMAVDLEVVGDGRAMVALSSPEAAERLVGLIPDEEVTEPEITGNDLMTFLSYRPLKPGSEQVVSNIKTQTGWVPSSRRAEDYLIARGLLGRRFHEPTSWRASEETVAEVIQRTYRPAKPDVLLTNSGMSAVSATIDTLHAIRNRGFRDDEPGRDTWIQIGTAYHDTESLLGGKLPDVNTRVIRDVHDLATLREIIESRGSRIAGVITEAPTNPLLEVPDLERIKAAIGDIPLVVDVSTASSLLVEALPYADVIVESLTKSPSGGGDILMGAVILNPESQYVFELREHLPDQIEQPYLRDVQRLAYEINGWRSRAARVGRSTVALAKFFESQNSIKAVHWAGSAQSRVGYAALARYGELYPGLITFELQDGMEPVYDALDLPKGPSFGLSNTVNTPYFFITHGNTLHDSAEQAMVERRTGLNPRQLRVSVGTENADELIERYREALKTT